MAYTVSQLIEYHAGRAIEELDSAEATETELPRALHLELSRLHLDQAGRLRATGALATPFLFTDRLDGSRAIHPSWLALSTKRQKPADRGVQS